MYTGSPISVLLEVVTVYSNLTYVSWDFGDNQIQELEVQSMPINRKFF